MSTQLSLEINADSAGAELSDCGRYRYRLWRRWANGRLVLWVCLNPSTADGTRDDTTTHKLRRYSERWDFAAFELVNLYAFRATDPDDLARHGAVHGILGPDGIEGPRNQEVIHGILNRTEHQPSLVMAAWGAIPIGKLSPVGLQLAEWSAQRRVPLGCIRTTKDGSPMHPRFAPERAETWRAFGCTL